MKISDSYLVFDVETTGFSPQRDRILQIGYCAVKDREIKVLHSILLHHPGIKIGKGAIEVHGITPEKTAAEGMSMSTVLPDFVALINEFVNQGFPIVAYNAKFDINFLKVACNRHHVFTDADLYPGHSDLVFDVAVLVRAERQGLQQRSGESNKDFSKRVGNPKGLKWALGASIERYKVEVTTNRAHDAAHDCLMTHLLLEKFREMEVAI